MSLEQTFAEHWPRLVAVLAHDTGDLGLAEDCLQDAFVAASETWGSEPPGNPEGWLYRLAKRRAIDRLRRTRALRERLPLLSPAPASSQDDVLLGMVFACCHPALGLEAQVALTLRYVAGLTTEQIARAYVVPTATMAKRLVRAKHKIRASGIPLTVPDAIEDRIRAVLQVIYLIFTEGHASRDHPRLVRGDLCEEAEWLATTVSQLLPREPEALGLAALIAFTDARRSARFDGRGRLVLLEDQDRSRWDGERIRRGHELLQRASGMGRTGPYQLQAAIAALHASSPSYDATDWEAIVALYRRLFAAQPSPIVALNLGAAVAMTAGPDAALAFIDARTDIPHDYPYLPVTRGSILERMGRPADAVAEYRRAIALLRDGAERDDLLRRTAALEAALSCADGPSPPGR
ncbi:RNA polymerase sigma factor [Microbacterium album]|uniref:RNA polymerase subunit sigma-24 n=1 Tax=Microbacterium album TaxID=2053191 RepID=A0A917ID13_9MICO|nr:sigma-70 family RNA polymerase sigma factor [Microbacterium album]GGH33879.1 RNA polymerase subunit sigma-24 [Microbacterium album]